MDILRALFDEKRRTEIRDALKTGRPIEFRKRAGLIDGNGDNLSKTIYEELSRISREPPEWTYLTHDSQGHMVHVPLDPMPGGKTEFRPMTIEEIAAAFRVDGNLEERFRNAFASDDIAGLEGLINDVRHWSRSYPDRMFGRRVLESALGHFSRLLDAKNLQKGGQQ